MITILPEYTNDGGAFVLCEDGTEIARCTYTASPGKGEITDLITAEGCKFSRIDGVVRAVLNSLDLRGVTTIRCRNKNIFSSLEKVGFKISDEEAVIDTVEFFGQPCQGH